MFSLKTVFIAITAISIGGGGDNQRVNMQFITVESREQLEELQRLESIDGEHYKALLEQSIAAQAFSE